MNQLKNMHAWRTLEILLEILLINGKMYFSNQDSKRQEKVQFCSILFNFVGDRSRSDENWTYF